MLLNVNSGKVSLFFLLTTLFSLFHVFFSFPNFSLLICRIYYSISILVNITPFALIYYFFLSHLKRNNHLTSHPTTPHCSPIPSCGFTFASSVSLNHYKYSFRYSHFILYKPATLDKRTLKCYDEHSEVLLILPCFRRNEDNPNPQTNRFTYVDFFDWIFWSYLVECHSTS